MARISQKELLARALKIDAVAGIGTLLKIVNQLDDAGRKIVLSGLNSTMTETKKQQILAALRMEVSAADAKVRDWVVQGVSNVYVYGTNTTVKQLKDLKFKPPAGSPPLVPLTVELIKTTPYLKPHLQAVNALVSDTYLDFGNTMTGYLKGAERTLNDATKRQVRATIAAGRLEGASVAQIKRTVKENIGQQGFSVLLDRGGRQWELGRYSEMVTRTHLNKANNEAAINRSSDFSVDIVEVSEHGSDDICGDYEGKLYSISGDSENYPPLDGNEPPYHPNCTHNLMMRPDLS